jgi:hypothetical protein
MESIAERMILMIKLAKPLKRGRYRVGGSNMSKPAGESGMPATAIDLAIKSVRLSTSLESVSQKTSTEPESSIAEFYAQGLKKMVPDVSQLWLHSMACEMGALESLIFIGPATLKLVTADLRLREFELSEGIFQLVRWKPDEHADIRPAEIIQIQKQGVAE